MRAPAISIAVSAYSSEPSENHLKKALEIIDVVLEHFGLGRIVWFLGGYKGLMKYVVNHLLERGEKVVLILPLEYEREVFPRNVIVVRTGMTFPNRNTVMVRSGDALLSLGGGAGTIMETIAALEMGRTVISLVGTGLPSDNLVKAFPGPVFDARKKGKIFYVNTPEEAKNILGQYFVLL